MRPFHIATDGRNGRTSAVTTTWRLQDRLRSRPLTHAAFPGVGGAGLAAGAYPRRSGLLPGPAVAVQRAALHRPVDLRDQGPVLAVGPLLVAVRDRGLEPAEVRLDGRRLAEVLRALALRPGDPLFL